MGGHFSKNAAFFFFFQLFATDQLVNRMSGRIKNRTAPFRANAEGFIYLFIYFIEASFNKKINSVKSVK